MAGPNAFLMNGPTFRDIGFDQAIGSYGFIVMVSNQVQDTVGNPFPAGNIGNFKVAIANASAIHVGSMLGNGQVSVSNTTLDIGPVGNLFDGGVASHIRTPGINPAVVTDRRHSAPSRAHERA